jgi:hypothetical protein
MGEGTAGVQSTPPVRAGATGPGHATGPATVKLPASTIEARWEKKEVEPVHNASHPPATPPTDAAMPAACVTKLLITTKKIADETVVAVSVRRCATKQDIPGGTITGLVVRGNRVVDPKTGDAPAFSFTEAQKPWLVWDKPFFYFVVQIGAQVVSSESNCEDKPEACLRVVYWVQCMSDTSLATSAGTCNTVKSEVLDVDGARAEYQGYAGGCASVPIYTSYLRNTYAVYSFFHGNCLSRKDNLTSIQGSIDLHQPPPQGLSPAEWRSVVTVKGTAAGAASPWLNYGDAEVAVEASTPGVPAVLYFGNHCLTGYEPSFANEMMRRGCRNLILFRRVIWTGDCDSFASDFWSAWAGYDLNPNKVADAFFKTAPDYEQMSPALFGPSAKSAESEGLSPGEIAGIVIGSIAGAALIGVGIWACVKFT